MRDPGTHRLGRVLGQDEALTLCKHLLTMVRASDSFGVWIEHTARAVTTLSQSRFRTWTVGDELAIWFDSRFGSGWPLRIATNDLDPAKLQHLVAQAIAMLVGPGDRVNPDDPIYNILQPRTSMPVSLWHATTARAMEAPAADVLGEIVTQVDAAHLHCSATAVLESRALCYMYEPGLTAYVQETDSELTVTARSLDGTATGWAGGASRDWATMTSGSLTVHAIDWATRAQRPSAMEPGRHTVILSATAVGQLVAEIAGAFSAGAVRMGRSPFSVKPNEDAGHHAWSKLGQRVVDARLRMVSDPNDPFGGFPPFYEEAGSETPGLPIPAVTWIEQGTLQNLAFSVGDIGRQWSEIPFSARLEPVPSATTVTIEDMIADCAEGFYVNRFGPIRLIDAPSGTMSGVTRDGCFFIKDGKINRPVKNFWFLDSPLLAFNRLMHVGQAQRVALGISQEFVQSAIYNNPPRGRYNRWPQLPIIAPPMMIRDWHFNALTDAV